MHSTNQFEETTTNPDLNIYKFLSLPELELRKSQYELKITLATMAFQQNPNLSELNKQTQINLIGDSYTELTKIQIAMSPLMQTI